MNKNIIEDSILSGLADKIREKLGVTYTMLPSAMPGKIGEIPAGTGVYAWKRYRSRLPKGYTEVEYIQSSGTQYINTNFVPNQDTRVILDIEITDAISSIKSIFGVRTGTSSAAFGMWITNGVYYPQYGDVAYNAKPINKTTSGRVLIDMNKNVANVNGTSVTFSKSTFNSGYPLFLLNMNSAGTVDTRMMNCKTYACQIYDNGTLVRDYIPCINSDGTAGLYDMVNGVFYGNAGTDSFAEGPAYGEFIGYITSDAETDYPESGVGADGFVYEKIQDHYILYVWNKYEKKTTTTNKTGNINVRVDCTKTEGTSYWDTHWPTTLTVSTIDKSSLTADDFVGMVLSGSLGGYTYSWTLNSGGTVTGENQLKSWEYKDQTLYLYANSTWTTGSLSGSKSVTKKVTSNVTNKLGEVTSKDRNAYPDTTATQHTDGYYYEYVEERVV